MTGRRITSLDVRCPACGAPPGSQCRKFSDLTQTCGPHGARRDEAARQDRIARPAHVDGQQPLFGRGAL